MALGKATIRFRNGTQLVFSHNACHFEHGAGRFIVLHLQDSDGRITELAFTEDEVESTAITTESTPIGFKQR
jgi:hypothetical protein